LRVTLALNSHLNTLRKSYGVDGFGTLLRLGDMDDDFF